MFTSVLNDFTANTNYLPTILDGPKRDRYVWSGDLAVSWPTVYYSNGASDYIKGSLRLFGSYQLSNGRLFGSLPPQLVPGLTAADNTFQPVLYTWGLPYSIYFVTNLYDYYLYTGDLSFVRRQWPGVDFHRTSFGGRSPEYMTGEDPFLGAVLVAAAFKHRR